MEDLQDLLPRWRTLWSALGLSGNPDPIGAELLRRWSEPWRHYHSLEHLRFCLAELGACPAAAADRPILEAALWLHDAVYDPEAKDNEERSAALAAEHFGCAGMLAAPLAEIARLILATRHQAVPEDESARLLADIDLAILGQPTGRFDRYEEEIRAEYAWVPWPDYAKGRSAILEDFLKRPAIYGTPRFRERCESSARHNLARSLGRLRPERQPDA